MFARVCLHPHVDRDQLQASGRDIVLIARTDAAHTDFEEALERCRLSHPEIKVSHINIKINAGPYFVVVMRCGLLIHTQNTGTTSYDNF